MKKISVKIATFIVIVIIFLGCDAEKRVPNDKYRLTKNEILVNGKRSKSDEISSLLNQKPNSTFLGLNLRLYLFNLAKANSDSIAKAKFEKKQNSKRFSEKQNELSEQSFKHTGINSFLAKTGEPPVIIDSAKTSKSVSKLKNYYLDQGFFDVKTKYVLDSLGLKKAKIKYEINTNSPFLLDSLLTKIKTPVLDSLYQTQKINSFLKSGKQYNLKDFESEQERISTQFRNQGVYHFQPNYVSFDLDTLNENKKINATLVINNFSYQGIDSSIVEPFKVYKISDVNIYTDYSSTNSNAIFQDSVSYKNFNLFSQSKLKYRPKAITNAVFITKGSLFSDQKTVLTSRYLNNLKIFSYPTIFYELDKRDKTAQSLIAKIYLSQQEKYKFKVTGDVTHSNIQDVGIAGSISQTIRNIFNGAETLQLSVRGSLGSSKELANPENKFFNLTEFGLDMKLNIPRIWFPFKTEKIIPKSMIPSTLVSLGVSNQKNIGLDKQNATGILNYNWSPQKGNTAQFDLFNFQYVRNINPENYFNIYRNSYSVLNNLAKLYPVEPNYFDGNGNLKIEDGTKGFTNDVLAGNAILSTQDYQTVSSIEERRVRLTENDFILASSYSFVNSTKTDLKDNTFFQFKTKIESAGSVLSLASKVANLPKNANGKNEIFNLEYSEYIKTEFDFIKYWELSKNTIVAFRSFFGIAIPYGNSNNIPFSRSYFAGGSNDNRAWEPYRLGPGSSGAINDFNEANMKLALNTEFRFKIFGKLRGAFFADAGNIWNVLDNIEDPKATFDGVQDLKDLALGTGFGFRYDLDFFVLRMDLGLKTYNPANEIGKRWFYDYDFVNSVFNFGINYPF